MKLRYLAMVALILVPLVPAMLNGQTLPASSRPEEVEWTWEVRPTHLDSKLPNVLLIGDSISRNYYPEVQRQLASVANVYLFAASTSLGDPRLLHQLAEFASTEDVQFQVVHFNNGMHGWMYSEEEYKSAFPDYIHEIRQLAPAAKLIWASTTPVKADSSSGPTNPGPTNVRVDRRNSIAVAVMKKAGITIDDQNSLMTHHADTYEDNVHFALAGSTIQGRQASGSIRTALEGSTQ